MDNKFILPCCSAILLGFIAGQLCVFILNSVPPKWLCDYGEKPGAELYGKRFFAKKQGLASGAVLAAAFTLFCLNYHNQPLIMFFYCLAALALVMSSVSDLKYKIIPDQCVIFLAVCGVLYYIHGIASSQQQFDKTGPFVGALCGGGLWLLLGFAGKIIYKEESIGFGDVKLFAAAGFLLGFPCVLAAFFLTIVTAGIVFSAMLLLKKTDGKSYLPMAPYICASCIIVLALKERICTFITWYLSLIT